MRLCYGNPGIQLKNLQPHDLGFGLIRNFADDMSSNQYLMAQILTRYIRNGIEHNQLFDAPQAREIFPFDEDQ